MAINENITALERFTAVTVLNDRNEPVMTNSSCIGCGICVTVCPMDVLSFEPKPQGGFIQIETA